MLTVYTRAAYSGASLAFRDRLIIEWNRTQQRQTFADQKRVYCKAATLQSYNTKLIYVQTSLWSF